MITNDKTKAVMAAVQASVPKALTGAALMVQAAAKELCPVRKDPPGGNLKGSITIEVKSDYAKIGTNVDYAPHVEYRTKAHLINVKQARVLSDGKEIFGKTVRHPGTAAQPFLRPGLDNNQAAVEKYMAEIYRAAIKAVTG